MASITITVPDAVVPRILAALNAKTAADVAAWIKQSVQLAVSTYEAELIRTKGMTDSQLAQSNVRKEQW
jgi:hypothetical protein